MTEPDQIKKTAGVKSIENFCVEEELRESELKYKTLYESSRDAIMMLTQEEGFFSGNPATVDMFACKDEAEFISYSPADLSPEYQPDGKLSSVKAQEMMEIAMKNGSHFFEWTHRRSSGETFSATVLLTGMEVKGKKCLQATVRDITEKKMAEEALRESEERFRNIVENTSNWIWEYDERGIFTYSNGRVKNILGYEPEEILGKSFFDFVDKNSVGKKHMLPNKLPQEYILKHKNGNNIELNTKLVPFYHENGTLKGYHGISRDVTESKRVEREIKKLNEELEDRVIDRTIQLAVINRELKSHIEERKKIEKELLEARNMAESASRAKSDFIASMSHEFRTPLNSVLGYAQLFLKDEGLPEEYKRGMNIILKSGSHLLGLINDVMDMVKIEAKEIELYEKRFSLYNMLHFIENIMEVNRKKKELLFLYDYSSGLPEYIFGDEKRLTQILINLLSNAVKFTEKGYIRLTVDRHEGKLYFSVEDTGSGIPEDRLKEIFQPFKQINPILKKIEGAGLGLSISRKLVRLMGGELYVESTYGKGSKFWFSPELPEASPEKEFLHDLAHRRDKGSKRRISDGDDKEEYIEVPPSEILESLYHFIRKGNIKVFKKELEKVNSSADKYEVFYRKLTYLSDNFEIERLLKLLELSMEKQ